MQRFKSPGHAQRFLSSHAMIHGHFRPRRHLMTAFEETGHWFDPENPIVLEEPVDWNAVAARVTRNFEETGHWFY